MSQPTIDLTSELLRGMRLSGVNYRRIETSRPFGVGFSAVAGKSPVPFHQPRAGAAAHGQRGTVHHGERRRAVYSQRRRHALLSDPQRPRWWNVAQLNSETVCSTVSCINAGGQPDCLERAVIFSGCMDFELGGMQPAGEGHARSDAGELPAQHLAGDPAAAGGDGAESLTRQAVMPGSSRPTGGRGGRADCPRLGGLRVR